MSISADTDCGSIECHVILECSHCHAKSSLIRITGMYAYPAIGDRYDNSPPSPCIRCGKEAGYIIDDILDLIGGKV